MAHVWHKAHSSWHRQCTWSKVGTKGWGEHLAVPVPHNRRPVEVATLHLDVVVVCVEIQALAAHGGAGRSVALENPVAARKI